jgi:hypothetical protein
VSARATVTSQDAFLVLGILLLQAAQVVSAYCRLPTGLHLAVGLGAATLQASLLCAMVKLKQEPFATKLALAVAVAWVLLLLGMSCADAWTRTVEQPPWP